MGDPAIHRTGMPISPQTPPAVAAFLFMIHSYTGRD